MKKYIAFLLIIVAVKLNAQAPSADAIVGTWLTKGGKAKVQIYKSGSVYNGKIVWLKDPNYEDGTPKVDKKNPDKTKRKDPIIGLNLLKGFSFDEDHWANGTIYDPESGDDYKCTIKYNKGGWIEVRGYVGISLFGRTELWYHVADVK